MASYRLHDTTGDDVGLLEHPAPNLEPGDVVTLPDGQDALVTARVEAYPRSRSRRFSRSSSSEGHPSQSEQRS
jgi:hypothetical protein